MRNLSSLVLLILLLAAFTLTTLCVAQPAGSGCSSEMTITPHGDHCPAAPQPRACCQVDHGTPMTVPTPRLTAQPASVSAVISDADDGPVYAIAHFATRDEFWSPPPPAVLRI